MSAGWKERVARRAGGEIHALPAWGCDSIPLCNERCPHFDGKRCELMGCRPSTVCEPVVAEMAIELEGQP